MSNLRTNRTFNLRNSGSSFVTKLVLGVCMLQLSRKFNFALSGLLYNLFLMFSACPSVKIITHHKILVS